MAIPFAATTITVTRVEDASTTDPYDPPSDHPDPTTVAQNIRAVISPPTGTARLVGGDRVVYDAKLTCDLLEAQPNDSVVDAKTGLTWTLLSISQINAFGNVHTTANLRLVTGVI